jgi:predicted ATPase/transcriptional regulator with XRE-family HTH domain
MTADPPAAGPEFATLLRARRRAAGLTQAELAGLAGVAVRTVREVERGRTARPQRTTAVLLADALGLTGEERAGFLGAARGQGSALAKGLGPGLPALPRLRAAVTSRPAGLPPAPALWGRDGELTRLVELVDDPGDRGPVALVGVAGVGKTALALAVAQRAADRFPGGATSLVVDPHATVAELVDAVAAALGYPLDPDPGGAPALLLLDAVDRAPQQVRAALAQLPPSLRLVTTGRAPLGVPGELVWPVAPLGLPPAGADLALAEVGQYPAAALFLDRLARVRSEPPAPDEVPALVGLVRRLGGLPLAIELAAAHGRLLRVPEILKRYGDRVLDLGEGEGDDRTLRAAVAGSYRLLHPVQQHALRWLAAFRDRWSVDLAEQLLAAPGGPAVPDPVPLLDRLVSLGLVVVGDGREHRFRMLDVVHDFAAEQAERRGEVAAARRAHAVVIARLVARAGPALTGAGRPAAVARLDEVAAEIWAALNHAANDDPHTALALAAQLPYWWRYRGRDVAGRHWLRRLLADPRTAGADPAVRAWAMVGLARLAYEHGEGAAERPAAEVALATFRRLADLGGELAAAQVLSVVCLANGRYDEAREHSLSVLAVANRHGRSRDAAAAQLGLTWHEVRVGDLAAARRRLAAADRLAAQSGDRRLRVLATAYAAELARLAGRYEVAVDTGRRAMARLDEVGDPGHRRRVLATVGQALAALDRVADAERVLARLRADDQARPGITAAVADPRPAPAEGLCAAIEARLALARGDRVMAAEWFAAAAAAFRAGQAGQDRRDLLEALAELAGCLADLPPGELGSREQVLAELSRTRVEGGFVLLARERALTGLD